MSSLVKTLFVVTLLVTPVLVVIQLPRLFELANSVPPAQSPVAVATAVPAFRLLDTPTPAARSRIAPLDDSIPPTLAPPVATATPKATVRPTPTGERIIIGNTGGVGAVLRSDPVTGRPISALREQQVLDVLERRNIPGSGDWVRVRTADGVEGWVTGLVALPLPSGSH